MSLTELPTATGSQELTVESVSASPLLEGCVAEISGSADLVCQTKQTESNVQEDALPSDKSEHSINNADAPSLTEQSAPVVDPVSQAVEACTNEPPADHGTQDLQRAELSPTLPTATKSVTSADPEEDAPRASPAAHRSTTGCFGSADVPNVQPTVTTITADRYPCGASHPQTTQGAAPGGRRSSPVLSVGYDQPSYVVTPAMNSLGYTVTHHGCHRSYVPIIYPPREIIDDKLDGVCRAAYRVPEVPSPANIDARLAEYNSTLLYLNAHLKNTEHYYNLPFLRDRSGVVLFLPKGSVLPNVYSRVDNEDQMSAYDSVHSAAVRSVGGTRSPNALTAARPSRFAGFFSCCSQPVVDDNDDTQSVSASRLVPETIASPLPSSRTVISPADYHFVEPSTITSDGYCKRCFVADQRGFHQQPSCPAPAE